MKPEHISDALNFLDEDLLQEAEEARSRVIRRRPAWQKWGALAACLALAVFAGTRLFPSAPPPYESPVPAPGSDGPSRPVSGELPMITIDDKGAGGYGYEGYMAYDISELGGKANPWNEEVELTTLPVYRNPLTFDEMYRASGASEQKMKELLLDVAGKLGLDTQNTPITDNAPDEDYRRAITEKLASVGEEVPEGMFEPTGLIMEGNGFKIEVDQSLTARIEFKPPVELPEEYRFTYDAAGEEMKAAAEWLAKEYSGLLSGMAEPTLEQGMGDRNIYGERHFNVEYFDNAGSIEARIVNYNFNRVALYNDDEGKLFLGRVYAPDLSGKMGDYPIISVEEARELLHAGNYASSVPYDLTGEDRDAMVELVYRTNTYDAVWLPYYRFLVELPEDFRPEDKTLHDFGAYYVPAVDGRYITNMPTYDGSFNGGGTAVKVSDDGDLEDNPVEPDDEPFQPAEVGEPTPPQEEPRTPMVGVIVPGQK